jgi:hypothetical protein
MIKLLLLRGRRGLVPLRRLLISCRCSVPLLRRLISLLWRRGIALRRRLIRRLNRLLIALRRSVLLRRVRLRRGLTILLWRRILHGLRRIEGHIRLRRLGRCRLLALTLSSGIGTGTRIIGVKLVHRVA